MTPVYQTLTYGLALLFIATALGACGTSDDGTAASGKEDVVTIAANPNSPPFVSYKEGTTDFTGAEIELWKAVAKEAGFQPKFEAATLETTLTGVSAGRYD